MSHTEECDEYRLTHTHAVEVRNLGAAGVVLTLRDRAINKGESVHLSVEDFQEVVGMLAEQYELARPHHPALERGVRPSDLVCPLCGSTDIQVIRWVHARTEEVHDDCGDACWCNACEEAGRDQEGGTGTLDYQRPVRWEQFDQRQKR